MPVGKHPYNTKPHGKMYMVKDQQLMIKYRETCTRLTQKIIPIVPKTLYTTPKPIGKHPQTTKPDTGKM